MTAKLLTSTEMSLGVFFKENAQLSEDFHHENRPSKTLDVENNGMETRTTSRGPELGSTDGGRSKKNKQKKPVLISKHQR